MSPKELALVIEASESTIKRWVDKGKLHAEVTDGGHRKIAVEEAIRFIRQHQETVLRADLLGFPDANALEEDPGPPTIDTDKFYQFLINGDAQKARGYLVKLYLQGFSISEICDTVVSGSMNRIGEHWKQEQIGICLEHHATDICIQAVNALRMIFQPRHDLPIALGGAPEGDPYFIPSLCISTVMMSEGYQSINLGPNTPVDSFLRAVDQYHPSIVWISFTSQERPRHLTKQIETLTKTLSQKNVQVLVGGRESQKHRHLERHNVFFGTGMAEMAAFVRGLRHIYSNPVA